MRRRLTGQTALHHSPKSETFKQCFRNGANVIYIGSIDSGNPSSDQDLSVCVSRLLSSPGELRDTKIFINSQDYLRVINSTSGKLFFCIPIDVIENCIQCQQHYIAFSASTSIQPNLHTISMAHVFKCSSTKQCDELYHDLLRTLKSSSRSRDNIKAGPHFSRARAESSNSNRDRMLVMYHSSFGPENPSIQMNQNANIIHSNHSLFKNAFDYIKEDDQESLSTIINSELDIMFCDDAGQTLLHLAVRADKYIMGKYLVKNCCKSETQRDALRRAQDKDGLTALHIAALYGLKNFVNFLATDYETVNIKDLKGRIPLHYCAGKIMLQEITHILIDHGSKIEEPEVDGIRPVNIEPALEKFQEHLVAGAFVFIYNFNQLDRSAKRVDSGMDSVCSEKTSSEQDIPLGGTSVQSTDSCYSPRQDSSLTSIPEGDKPKPNYCASQCSSQCEEESTVGVGGGGGGVSDGLVSDYMRSLRENLSRLINMLNNPECHRYLLPQICQEKIASNLITIAQNPRLSDDCATAIAHMLNQLFGHNPEKKGATIRKCAESNLLKTLIRLLDSHVIIQAQAISILEEIFSHSMGKKKELDFIANFAELDPDLLLSLIHENDLPIYNTKQKPAPTYAKRLRSLSSPREFGESMNSGNSYFTKNWSRRLLIRILARTSLTKKMRSKMNSEQIVEQLIDLMNCPTMEIREHAVCTIANLALSHSNHEILLEKDIITKFHKVIDSNDTTATSYHCSRGLVYLGCTDVKLYVFEHNLSGQGIEECRLWSSSGRNQHASSQEYDHPDNHYVQAATLEDIVVIMTSDPTLLWNNIPLRVPYKTTSSSTDDVSQGNVRENEIIRFVLSLHKTFADTIVFFRLLVHRFRNPSVVPAKRYKHEIPPVHSKVCNVLCIWMEEFPWHFIEDAAMFKELEDFVLGLEDYGPIYYDLRDQIAVKCHTVHIQDYGHTLDKITHLDHYKHCKASLMNEEFPLSVNAVSWLSALRGVCEKVHNSSPPQQGFIRSILNFKERELTNRIKAMIPASYQSHPDVVTFTKNLFENLSTMNLTDREWQHMFVEAYFSHPLYNTELFYDIYLQEDPYRAVNQSGKTPVIVGVNAHHFVVVNRLTNEIIGHHLLTSLQKPIQWFTKPLDNVLCVSMEQEYRLVGQTPGDIEMLATLMVQHMGGKIELVDTTFYFDEEDSVESDCMIVSNNRHSWHANTTRNGYSQLSGVCPPTTPCMNSVIDITQMQDDEEDDTAQDESVLSSARSRLSLNIPFLGNQPLQHPTRKLRRVHTTNDVTMTETLKLVEAERRTSLTERLRSFSNSMASRLDKLGSSRTDDTSDESDHLLPKVIPHDSLIRPPRPSKRSIKRSPRISPKSSWERGVVKIDPETAQETVIITEKYNVLYQLKTSGASTPSTPPDHLTHVRVRNTSSYRNIDTAAFTKLLAQSMEMLEDRKRANRRSSYDTGQYTRAQSMCSASSGSTCKPRVHRPLSRSKTFSHTFDKLIASSSPPSTTDTPVELSRFTCLWDDANRDSQLRVKKAQDVIFSVKCDCPDVSHYTPCPCPPPFDLPYEFSLDRRQFDLLSYHREVARQLTLMDHELFANIVEDDLLEYTKKRDQPIPDYRSIHHCTEHHNHITETVQTIILDCEPRDIRIKLLEHFIDISHQCLLLRNFSAVFNIVFSALYSAAIRNLKSTWEGVSRRHTLLFDELLKITSPSMNHKVYRRLLQSSNAPTVPFLQVYLTEFFSINDDKRDYLKKGLINLQKRRLIYRELEEIRYFQKLRYNLKENQDIMSFFLDYRISEHDFYWRSEMIEKNDRERSKKSTTRRKSYHR